MWAAAHGGEHGIDHDKKMPIFSVTQQKATRSVGLMRFLPIINNC